MRVDVTWLRPGVQHDPMSGEDAESWAVDPIRTPLPECILWPNSSDESPSPDRPHHVTTSLSLVVPYGTSIEPGHRVVIETGPYARETPWHVDGLPDHWSFPWGDWEPGTVVTLVEVRG